MIKAVLFDFDGVLTIDKTGSAAIINYISSVCGIAPENVKSSYYRFNKRLLMGETTHGEIWQEFCESLGRDIDYSVLLDSFRNTRLDDKMIALVKRLKKRYLIGMVTDNKCDRISTILDYRGLNECFDSVAVSAYLHSGKDNHSIFEYALQTLNVSADECVFIDNTERNLIIPEQMGMSVLLFDDEGRDVEMFERELERIIS